MATKQVIIVVLALLTYAYAASSIVYDPLTPVRAALYERTASRRVAATCSFSKAEEVATSYKELLEQFSVDIVKAVKDGNMEFKSLGQLQSFLNTLITGMEGCQDLLESFVGAADTVKVDIPNTKQCVAEQGTSEFEKDPCCSQEAADKKCCSPRTVTVSVGRISRFANQTIYDTCRNPETVKTVIANFYRRYKNSMHQCAASAFKQQVMYSESVAKVGECYKSVFQNPRSCVSDDDCFTGSTCDISTNKCVAKDLQDGTPLVQCIKESVSEEAFYNLKYILGVEGKSDKDTITAFMNFVTTEMCVDGFTSIIPKTMYETQETCLAEKKCADNRATCSGSTNFCGALKGANGIYLADVTGLLPDQSRCSSHGLCVGAKAGDSYKFNKAECEAESFCTHPDCGDNCTKEKCEALGRCIGGVDKSFCLLPFKYNSNGRVCANSGDTMGPNGCISASITLEAICKIGGGKWYSALDTKEKCESFQVCANNGAINFRNQTVCEECGGKSVNIFKWAPARYLPRKFLSATTWATREEKSVNIWKRALDLGKLIPAFTKFSLALQYPIFKSQLACVMNPILTTLRMLSCDCDKSVSSTKQCFSDELSKSPAASFRLLGSVDIDQEYSTAEVSIFIKAGSRKLTVNVDITKTELLVDIDLSGSRRIAAEEGVAVSKGSSTVGQVVGNGFAMQGSSSISATLCIRRDQTMSVSNADYKNPAFAIKDSRGNFVITSVPINSDKTGDGSAQICGMVADSRTYYPAMVNDAAAPPVVSAAVTTKPMISVIVAVVIAVIALL